MREFGGGTPEPLVGQIVGLRTFRVDDAGLLLPLYSSGVWYDGPNSAACAPPTGRHHRPPHAAPGEDCECGFYAYGSAAAAAQNRQARHVQAVVSCWGGVVAGTRGVRAEHARIDALWLSPAAPPWLRKRVAGRYPSARLYADRDAMLAEHPLTELSCYEPPAPARRMPRVLTALAAVLLLVLGLLPAGVLHGTPLLWDTWLAATGCAAAFTAWLLLGAHGAGHVTAALLVGGVLAWLLAPLFGVSGWLLRLPVLRGLAVAGGGYLLALRPRHFPVVRTPRERAYRGIRA